MRAATNPEQDPDPAAPDVLRAAREELARRPPRTCLWPPCPEPARRPAGADDRPGGRPTEHCSEGHQRQNASEIRRLLAVRHGLAAFRASANDQRRRETDGVLAEIDRCLATHGAVAPPLARPPPRRDGPAGPPRRVPPHPACACGPDTTLPSSPLTTKRSETRTTGSVRSSAGSSAPGATPAGGPSSATRLTSSSSSPRPSTWSSRRSPGPADPSDRILTDGARELWLPRITPSEPRGHGLSTDITTLTLHVPGSTGARPSFPQPEGFKCHDPRLWLGRVEVVTDRRVELGHWVRLVLVGLTEVRRNQVRARLFVPGCLKRTYEADVLVDVHDPLSAGPAGDRAVAEPAQQNGEPGWTSLNPPYGLDDGVGHVTIPRSAPSMLCAQMSQVQVVNGVMALLRPIGCAARPRDPNGWRAVRSGNAGLGRRPRPSPVGGR